MVWVILLDVNILIRAHRRDDSRFQEMSAWLGRTVDSGISLGSPSAALAAFVRIVTHPRIYLRPTPLKEALDVVAKLRGEANFRTAEAGPRHSEIFRELCAKSGAAGNLRTHACFAAIAIEHGAEWITADSDYARFPGLRWRHPLKA